MANCSENKTPLMHGGSSQPDRSLPALNPASAPIIQKSPVDWLVWGRRMSQYIQYPFFGTDITARLAMVATHPTDSLSQFIRQQLNVLNTNSNTVNNSLMGQTLQSLFDLAVGYLNQVDKIKGQIDDFKHRFPEPAKALYFPGVLDNHIRQTLLRTATDLFTWLKTVRDEDLLTPVPALPLLVFNEPIQGTDTVYSNGLSEIWWQGSASWTDYLNNITAQPAWIDVPGTKGEKIQHIAQHNFFTGLLSEISGSAAALSKATTADLQTIMQQWPHHEPHSALWITFLQLLEYARKGMNSLTARHLDFYYKQVLQLKPIPAQADSAFLSFELNKAVSSAAVAQGTPFAGPKDETGKRLTYTADRETVLNKASIAHLHSIYIGDTDDTTTGSNNHARIFASPVANSADGLGGKLLTELQEWHPFFAKTFESGNVTSVDMPPAKAGFAISSHYLRLAEGTRTITLKMRVSNLAKLTGKQVEIWLTTEKEWHLAGMAIISNSTIGTGSIAAAMISITLPAEAPAVTGYTPKAHGGVWQTTEPVMQVILPQATTAFGYNDWLDVQLQTAELTVNVGNMGSAAFDNTGIKNLQLNSNAGILDASKPFMPFGHEPARGNALIIGSPELAVKPNARIKINVQWKDLPDNKSTLVFKAPSGAAYSVKAGTAAGDSPNMHIQVLQQGNWHTIGNNQNLFAFNGNTPSANATYNSAANALGANFFVNPGNPYQEYSKESVSGFIRIRLQENFGHQNYRNAHTDFLIKKGLKETAAVVNEPYHPVLESLTLSYTATCTLQLTGTITPLQQAPMQWLHVHPFGYAQQHPSISGSPVSVVPQLALAASPFKAQGSLYIGLKDIEAGKSIAILFQVLEGTANPLRAKPEKHIQLSYLSQNVWKNFEDNEVEDGTAQWIKSGLIHFTLPEDITTGNTLLSDTDTAMECLWLKATVTEAPDAVCALIGIHVNAIQVTRQMANLNVVKIDAAPAASITKMIQPDARFKKINQPYAGFNGRATESADAYYVRVSERLRHKDRAVTLWDYEKLVLQAFPEIYKVKCLNHTKIAGSIADGNLEYNEVAPGHVAIITIPNLSQRNDTDPLKPYTRKSTLDAIEVFLKQRTSCHVKLKAEQPRFEEIRMAAKVILLEGYSDAQYYRSLLQQELTEYLSPWAYGHAGAPGFGGQIHKSVLIDFIEERAYVDYLTDVELFHKKGEDAVEGPDSEAAIASTAASILVSAPSHMHQFAVMTPTMLPPVIKTCPDE